MAHVTFIHGSANKPPVQVLRRVWKRSLARDGGLDLGRLGVSSAMVYWADLIYPRPDPEGSETEVADSHLHPGDPEIDFSWRDGLAGEERRLLEQLTERFRLDQAGPDDELPSGVDQGFEFERIPLARWIKRRLLGTFVRDVHHYLFDAESAPRPGERFGLRSEVRQRVHSALDLGARCSGPHVVVAHSLGALMVYDCLANQPDCPPVDALMTIASPLGLDEVRELVAADRDAGFPTRGLRGPWINVFDHLDPIAGFAPELAERYQSPGAARLVDLPEANFGRWRHNASKYLGGAELRQRLRRLLGC